VIADASVFERHLDLRPLRGRRRGLVRCRFHEDKTPSLSVDLERGLFCCHGCGNKGGIRRFAELVGELAAYRPRVATPISDYESAVRTALRREREAADRRAEWLPFMLANDHIRIARKTVEEARRWAQVLGPDHPRTWPVLALAARAETDALNAAAQLDQLLEEGRLQLDAIDALEPILARAAGRGR
jgi:hypothetical protein